MAKKQEEVNSPVPFRKLRGAHFASYESKVFVKNKEVLLTEALNNAKTIQKIKSEVANNE